MSRPADGEQQVGAGPVALGDRSEPGRPLPAETRRYLERPALGPLWVAARARLERNGLAVTRSAVWVELNEEGRSLLHGLLGVTVSWQNGTPVPVRLDLLDAALRRSAALRGLVAVLTELGGPVLDRQVRRAEQRSATTEAYEHLDAQVVAQGLAGSPWAAAWLAGIRRSGLLTRAGTAAAVVSGQVCAVLGVLNGVVPLTADPPVLAAALPADPVFELGELATRCAGSAHDLDGTPAAAIVLRALAAARGIAAPRTAAERRELWAHYGVTPDSVSGTVLLWALRPPGAGPWARMMRARADLGLVTHVTLQEWRTAAAAEPWTTPGQVVSVCENPQVLQAAARAGIEVPLLCLSGNPATVGLAVLDGLLRAGAIVRYHGDLDVAGVAIAGRLISRGVRPWRMSAEDYRAAVAATGGNEHLALTGQVGPTGWDPALAAAMNATGVAVHEEAILEDLLADLRTVGRGEHGSTTT